MPYNDPRPWGHVAEWLRNGLQNRVHQFNSGRGLHFPDIATLPPAPFCARLRNLTPRERPRRTAIERILAYEIGPETSDKRLTGVSPAGQTGLTGEYDLDPAAAKQSLQ